MIASETTFDVQDDLSSFDCSAPVGMPGVWRDCRFRSLDGFAQRVALYCMQGDQTMELGIQKFSPGEAAEDLLAAPDEVRNALEYVCQTLGWRWDSDRRVLWMVDHRLRYPKLTQAMIRRGIRQTASLPKCPVLQQFLTDAVPDEPRLDAVWRAAVASLRRPGDPRPEPSWEVVVSPDPDPDPDESLPVVTAEPEPALEVSKKPSIPTSPTPSPSRPFGAWASPFLVNSSPIYDPKFLTLLGLPTQPSPFSLFPFPSIPKRHKPPSPPDKSSTLRAQRRKEKKRRRAG